MTSTSAKAPGNTAVASQAAPINAATGEKAELNKIVRAALLAERPGLIRVQCDAVVTAVLEEPVNAVQELTSVTLDGLGTSRERVTAARTGVRAGTTERMRFQLRRSWDLRCPAPSRLTRQSRE